MRSVASSVPPSSATATHSPPWKLRLSFFSLETLVCTGGGDFATASESCDGMIALFFSEIAPFLH